MANKNSIFAVIAVTLMVTAGVGVIWNGSDETEAVTSDTPLAELQIRADNLYDAYTHGTTSYNVAYGTYINVSNYNTQDEDVGIQAITTTYGDNAGLTITSGNLAGTVNKATAGTITVEGYVRDSGGTDVNYYVTLNVLDITSTQTNTWTAINLPANVFIEWGSYGLSGNIFYVEVGSSVTITKADVTVAGTAFEYGISSINNSTTGFGLSIPAGTDSLTGTITQAGTITVGAYHTDQEDIEEWEITIEVVDSSHADVRLIGGETWTYTPSTNISSVVSISGTATAWVSLTGGTVSGTAPTNTSVGQTYDLTITANSTQPSQTATQTVTFTVDPQITVTASSASQTILYGTGSVDIISSNYEDGTRSIYSLTGVSGYSVNAVSGVISYSNPDNGAVTITASSPYTYTSGATNSASTTVTFDVQGILSASTSGTLYLVTGKTVPNTPAEAVTLSHSDVGTGTYTWAVTGANTSGVTVASDGTIGGTPGAIGTYAVTVTCTSVVGGNTQTADTTLNIVIVAVLAFTSSPAHGIIS